MGLKVAYCLNCDVTFNIEDQITTHTCYCGSTCIIKPKRDQAVAKSLNDIVDPESKPLYPPTDLGKLNRQLTAAGNENQKLQAQIIGLKQQVNDLKVGISKLKAIKKELRNIIDLHKEAAE